MTAHSDDELDRILSEFSQVSDTGTITLTWTNKDVIADVRKKLIAWSNTRTREICLRVIGEIERPGNEPTMPRNARMRLHGRNELRAAQRQTLNKELEA
jgi:hypothetical protein